MCRAVLLLALLLVISSTSVFAGKRFDDKSPHSWMNGYTLILVDANSKEELAIARDFITAQGGRIAVVLPPRAILGWVPANLKARLIGHHKIRSISLCGDEITSNSKLFF